MGQFVKLNFNKDLKVGVILLKLRFLSLSDSL